MSRASGRVLRLGLAERESLLRAAANDVRTWEHVVRRARKAKASADAALVEAEAMLADVRARLEAMHDA